MMRLRSGGSPPLLVLLGLSSTLAVSACLGVLGPRDGDPDGSGPGPGPQGEPLDCSTPHVAAVPLQRLTSAQYVNSVRDLLGITDLAREEVTSDEKIGAFDSNIVVPVGGATVERYQRLAERLAAEAADRLGEIVPCDAGAIDAACVDDFIARFGRKAYRRPLSADEIGAYRALIRDRIDGQDFAGGVRRVVQTMLQSPYFLYRVELSGSVPQGGQAPIPLGPYELATRVAYFLWNTTPDDALLDAAAAGALDDAEGLRAEAERMLGDPRARDTLASFHVQWLDLAPLKASSKDTTVYPAYDDALRDAMTEEVVSFADQVVRDGDGSFETLMSASYAVLDGPLFDLYGVSPPAGTTPGTPVRVELDPTERAGLLTRAGFLAAHAHANQSSPVQRGKVVLQNILCQTLPTPPPDVNTTPPEPSPDATTRERFEQHEKDPACAGCHALIDGIGMGFEHYDAIGAYRAEDGGEPVDATGTIVQPAALAGPFDGAVELAQKLAQSDEARQCVAKQWFRFALARPETDDDACALQGVYASFQASGYNVRDLLLGLVTTDAFRLRRVDQGGSP